ncbi:tetratricopeptide repeat protein [Flammeovirga sp. OC4]|uniref:tetratricopeptide repeat protein n=1 Tax=Flammeovirga sp. OC4 TaxID=1382345 RepID=UPI0005C76422|nr:tetratricopeptide repeat protein [Flammeovirga sp. OC4]
MKLFTNFILSRLLKKANKLESREEFQKSLDLHKKILSKNPNYQASLVGASICLLNLGHYQDALQHINKVINNEEKPAGSQYMIRALVYDKMGDLARTISELEQLLNRGELAKENFPYFGVKLFEAGKYHDAKKMFYKALEVSDNNELINLCIADCYSKLGKNKNQRQVLETVIEKNPNNVTALNNLGFLHLNNNEYQQALLILNKAIKLDPNYAFAYNNRGYAQLKIGAFDESFKDISKSIELDPNNSYAFRNLALYYLELNKVDDALNSLYKSKSLGFRNKYGSEVDELIKKLEL